MTLRVAIIYFLLISTVHAVESGPVSPGDWLFVQARIIGCGESLRDVDVAEVEASGEAVFFNNISLPVSDASLVEIATQLTEAVETSSDHRPTTIRVAKVSKDDPEQATMRMMQIFHLRKKGCTERVPPAELPEWLFDLHLIAMEPHNNSFKSNTKER